MCREGAWAELAAEVTFMVGIQNRMPGLVCKKIYFSPLFNKRIMPITHTRTWQLIKGVKCFAYKG